MHAINLAFHEAGHVIFRVLGNFMMVLGGSLMQLLIPAAVMVAFVFKHDNSFGGAVALWWLGQSAMDLAPYIYDARSGQLLLIGGFIVLVWPGISLVTLTWVVGIWLIVIGIYEIIASFSVKSAMKA